MTVSEWHMLTGAGTTKIIVSWESDGQKTLGESHRKPEEEGVVIRNPPPYLTAEETEGQKEKESSGGGTPEISHS